ncbi:MULTISPECIES: c-type cytochrome biogenesis protein CcsB [Leifsonia]|uniref:Cytochrome c-type biogenesis protein CcsB n=6 Tax=Leifsonia TaxID=110932 RepID=A0A7W4V0C5_LEIAQ|nr:MULTISPECIES: c-type cytochrome biogenesis protein CcsB [Leifsonia]RDV43205.1 c-type cytochrome biogenesis protein CcsB [Leifsonia sp. ku-ls]MBB2969492.1 cytochrome c-type biogenesis protein CcsB [Leifsonia aquatica]MBO1741513.1 c-type cytochrome biogenesis protein CcsB [Leifsonia sp. TF02-11]MCI0159497.1 c-type cytochrome biogenesis protein CcsB [Leifsonia shinshuensis]MDN4599520.1 c-type cytochrome biogenesis protein CcsB [Leifsonia virtsii]
MTGTLSALSTVALYVAMGFYTAAFVVFSIDLARRGAEATTTVPSAVARRIAATQPPTTVVIGEESSEQSTKSKGAPSRAARGVTRWAFGLTIAGFAFHLIATVLRGVAAARVPWANMWEFSMTGTLVIVGVFLLANLKWDIKYLGTFIVGLVLVLQGVALLRYYVPVVPLQPALQSYWLVIHIIVAVLGTAFFALGFALSGLQLLQYRREGQVKEFLPQQFRFLATLPDSVALENLAYRINIVGFIAWTFTLIAGAIWASAAWGRYWGWDTKEVWTFIIWVIYAGYIHARATRGWRGSRSAWLAIIGFAAVLFNFGIVNVFFKGLHTYSGL